MHLLVPSLVLKIQENSLERRFRFANTNGARYAAKHLLKKDRFWLKFSRYIVLDCRLAYLSIK